jgi:hypothetical protein
LQGAAAKRGAAVGEMAAGCAEKARDEENMTAANRTLSIEDLEKMGDEIGSLSTVSGEASASVSVSVAASVSAAASGAVLDLGLGLGLGIGLGLGLGRGLGLGLGLGLGRGPGTDAAELQAEM